MQKAFDAKYHNGTTTEYWSVTDGLLIPKGFAAKDLFKVVS